MKQVIIVVLLLLYFDFVYACAVPMPGLRMNADELINEAENIYLIEVTRSENLIPENHVFSEIFLEEYPNLDGTYLIHHFKILEVIKGASTNLEPYKTFNGEHNTNNFNNHNSPDFWNKDIGRVLIPHLGCGPIFSFKTGESYLYFPDKLGAMKSAELILNKNDKWYKYVKEKVNGTK